MAFDDNTNGTSGGGRWSRFFSRMVENPDNPAGWSLFLFRFRAIEVRIHFATVLFMISMLLYAIPKDGPGIAYMLASMVALFVVVLLHEFGHCFACRAVGGEADRIVMLPFGGVALAMPPQEWRANLVTTLGGPGVNAAILLLTSTALTLLGAADAIIFNLLKPSTIFIGVPQFNPSWPFSFLLALHVTNVYILLFNLALVIFPFDGGRIVQALMWARIGYRRATEYAVNIGFVGAMVLGIVAAFVLEEVVLVLIALFGGFACWAERQRLRAELDLAGQGGAFGAGHDPLMARIRREERDAQAAQRKLEREQKRTAQDEQELDRLLSKISASGIGSLSAAEKRALARLSKQKRRS